MNSLRGHLLLSSVRLADPNFARTVVLILAHDDNGALGLVLNRSLGVDLRKLSREVLGEETPREGMLYRGGPCESAVMVVYDDTASTALHEHLSLPTSADPTYSDPGTRLAVDLRFSGDRDVIEALLRSPTGEARFFAGYSGWSAGQLESELAEEAWLVLPARADHLFTDPDRVYEHARAEIAMGAPVSPQIIPRNPAMN